MNGLIEICQSLLVLLELVEGKRSVLEGNGVVRAGLQRLGVVHNRLLVFLEYIEVEESLVVQGVFVVGVQDEAPVIICQCRLNSAQTLIGVAPVVIGHGLRRVECESLRTGLDSILVKALLDPSFAPSDVYLCLLPLVVRHFSPHFYNVLN